MNCADLSFGWSLLARFDPVPRARVRKILHHNLHAYTGIIMMVKANHVRVWVTNQPCAIWPTVEPHTPIAFVAVWPCDTIIWGGLGQTHTDSYKHTHKNPDQPVLIAVTTGLYVQCDLCEILKYTESTTTKAPLIAPIVLDNASDKKTRTFFHTNSHKWLFCSVLMWQIAFIQSNWIGKWYVICAKRRTDSIYTPNIYISTRSTDTICNAQNNIFASLSRAECAAVALCLCVCRSFRLYMDMCAQAPFARRVRASPPRSPLKVVHATERMYKRCARRFCDTVSRADQSPRRVRSVYFSVLLCFGFGLRAVFMRRRSTWVLTPTLYLELRTVDSTRKWMG